ncbi:hypothetical protein [Egicoccus sp. AB-alg6-2]|uniref:hypothetical protein n=1 Tax=Egicoccus sp. AB-alg6-2 TaxID=3242692 RepID=UPI00359D01F6
MVAVDDAEVVRLAAAPTDDPSLKDAVVSDAEGLRGLWRMADIDGEAPTLPAGTVGIFVIARHAESTCRATTDVTGVEIDNGVAVVLLDPNGEFLRPCPGPDGSGAWTAFAVAIPDHYDVGLTGASSRLAAASQPSSETSDAAADDERGPAPDVGTLRQAQLSIYGNEPFLHRFVVFATDEQRREWCVASYLGDDVPASRPEHCQWQFTLDAIPYNGPAQPMGWIDGADAGLIVWGIEPRPDPGESTSTTVLFDGEPTGLGQAGSGGTVPFALWSAGDPSVSLESIEIRQAAETVATMAWPPSDDDPWGAQQLQPPSPDTTGSIR